jgi:hypothetical protein
MSTCGDHEWKSLGFVALVCVDTVSDVGGGGGGGGASGARGGGGAVCSNIHVSVAWLSSSDDFSDDFSADFVANSLLPTDFDIALFRNMLYKLGKVPSESTRASILT